MQKKNKSLNKAATPYQFIAHMHRWKYSALTAAVVAFVGLYAPDASALGLGPMTVQSALGEPLRAEIDLPQITPAEAESLRAVTAAPEAFRAQGLEYSPTANKVRMQLHRYPDGRSVLRLTSDTPVQDPFVDFVVDARWNRGQITRSYTMLFDPPALRRTPAPLAAPAQMAAPAGTPSSSPSRLPRPAVVARTPAIERAPAPAPAPTSAPPRSSATVAVKQGDTAGRIAGNQRAEGVSLDQMLVAMLRANPNAFIGGNVNRIKAGAVLQIPGQDDALATPAAEARKIVAVQSRDFNAFRRKLAQAAPAAQQAAAERSASGSVQTRVDDTSASAAAPDKLTLSKGAMQGKKSTEELLAQRKQGNAASARAQELSKNIDELSQLSAASTAPPGNAPAPGAVAAAMGAGPVVPNPGITLPAAEPAKAPPPSAPAAEVPAPAPSASDTVAPAAAAAVAAAADDTQTPAPAEAPVAPAPAPVPALTPAPAPEPSFLSELMDDPMVPLAGGALLLLLAGYGAYRVMQRRRNPDPLDSAFLDSRVQPDSFFGASGGQRVDTAGSETTTGGSSLAFSHSQLDAGGDVDPVAEADVYLAYGRDLQAEEILKEAARHNPTRVSIHAKLGEIYAKRQDRKALEAVATDVYKLTQGQGTDWARMVDLGSTLDPDNPLYRPGGPPTAAIPNAVPADSGFASTFTAPTDHMAPAPLSHDALDLDLDLDFDLPGDALTEAPSAPLPSFADAAAAVAAAAATTAVTNRLDPGPEPLASQNDAAWNTALTEPTGPDADAALDAMPLPDIDLADIDLADIELALEDAAPQSLLPEIPEIPEIQEIPEISEVVPENALNLTDTTSPSLAHLDFSMDELPALDTPQASDPDASAAGEAAFKVPDSGMLEFDLDDLSLDLDTPETDTPSGKGFPAAAQAIEDPLATKLALAQEFNTIGDSEGARTLIEEVIAESSGELKARAQRMLAEID